MKLHDNSSPDIVIRIRKVGQEFTRVICLDDTSIDEVEKMILDEVNKREVKGV